jgi:hypothetical protein
MGKTKHHATPEGKGMKVVVPIVPAKHRICIQVIDEEGKVLKGIEVRLEFLGKKQSQTTDEKGMIELGRLGVGTFKILTVDGEPMYELMKYANKPIVPPRKR